MLTIIWVRQENRVLIVTTYGDSGIAAGMGQMGVPVAECSRVPYLPGVAEPASGPE